ncbi:MAG: PP2C family serine/threonine-protein phosphatase [Pseudomonas sp.]
MLPATVKSYKAASYSHVGMVRQVNEDACLEATANGLWVVADGMGGHAAGDYVSSLIVDTLRRIPPVESLPPFISALRNALAQVNEGVQHEALQRGVSMMGATVVLLAARGSQAVCLWAGDSRLYRLRGGRLEMISHDHSYVQELLDNGVINEDEAKVHPRANVVTRAVGVFESLDLQSVSLQVMPGDSFLLCSDGLTKVAEESELADVLCHCDPYAIVRSLVHLGLTRGAPDNITAMVVRAL